MTDPDVSPEAEALITTMVRRFYDLALADDLLLVNPAWVDRSAFAGFTCIEIDPSEPSAANALRLPDRIIFPAAFPRTANRLARHALTLHTVDASELAKAEGAVTCCSLIVLAHT